MEIDDLNTFDEASYAASTSLVSFLLTEADEQTLLRFAVDGQRYGWDAALQSHYGIQSQRELQSQWQAWLTANFGSLE
jgi:hypothetical protein